MDSRTYATIDRLHAVQQAIEASLMNHREEMRKEFTVKLENRCNEAVDTALRVAQEALLTPQLDARCHELNTRIIDVDCFVRQALQGNYDTGEKLVTMQGEIRIAHERADAAASELCAHAGQHAAVAEFHSAFDEHVRNQFAEVRSEVAAEREQRERLQDATKAMVQQASDIAAARTRSAAEREGGNFSRIQRDLASTEAQLAKRLEDSVLECRCEAERALTEAAERISKDILAAEAQAQQGYDHSIGRTETIARSLEEQFCTVTDEACRQCKAASNHFADQRANDVALSLRQGLEDATQHTQKMQEEACAEYGKWVAALEERVAEVGRDVASEYEGLQEALMHAGVARSRIRREVQFERRRVDQAIAKLHSGSEKSNATTKVFVHNQVGHLFSAIADAESRLSEEAAALNTHIQVRPTEAEVRQDVSSLTNRFDTLADALIGSHSQMEAGTAELAARMSSTQQQAMEGQTRQHNKVMALGEDIHNLRAAFTSLANGVLAALQVIGLVDDDPLPSACGPGAGGDRVEDLLHWEKSGWSLPSQISRRWQTQAPVGKTTMVAALRRKAEAEEITGLKAFVDSALQRPHRME